MNDMVTPVPATLSMALARAQAEFPFVENNATGVIQGREGKAGYKYEYAKLGHILKGILPPLNKHGISLRFDVSNSENNRITAKVVLLHESGEVLESSPLSAQPSQPGLQAIGGVISYLKRYQLVAFLGVPVGEPEEDDGEREEEAVQKSRARTTGDSMMPRAKPKEEQAESIDKETGEINQPAPVTAGKPLSDGAKNTLRAAMVAAGLDDAGMKAALGVSFADVHFGNIEDVRKKLRDRVADAAT